MQIAIRSDHFWACATPASEAENRAPLSSGRFLESREKTEKAKGAHTRPNLWLHRSLSTDTGKHETPGRQVDTNFIVHHSMHD